MNRKQKIIQYLNAKHPHRTEFLVMLLISLVLASCYLYNDIVDTTAHGIKFWNCLTEGTLPMFYSQRYIGAKDTILPRTGGGGYDFALYFIFAIYNFPTWIWEKVSGFSFVEFVWTKEYIKGISWVFVGLCSYALYRLAKECGIDEDEAKWCPFLFMSSAIFFHAEVVMGGYDVISLVFTLLGLYAYIKGNNKGFVMSFAVAIAMKYFALWLFIPLVLLKEKRVWRIIVYGIEGISVVVVPKVFFIVSSHLYMQTHVVVDAEKAVEKGYSSNALISHAGSIINDVLFPDSEVAQFTFIAIPGYPLFLLCIVLLWLWCYLYKKQLSAQKLIYLCAVAMSVFALTVRQHPQWCILLVPYVVLIIMFHPEKMKENLILEGVYSLGRLLNVAIMYSWTCNMNLIENMTIPQHRFSYADPEATGGRYGLSYYILVLSDLTNISAIHISYIFKAVASAALIAFLVWNYPGRNRDVDVQTSDNIDYVQRRKWYYTRLAVSCLWGMVPLVGLIVYLT